MRQVKQHSISTHSEGTPLDEELRIAFSKLIKRGMYAVVMNDDSMVPFIQKGSLVFFKEDHAVSRLVEVIYKDQRFIRIMRAGVEEHHWIYYPANHKYKPFYSTAKNCPEFRIIGNYCFSLQLGKSFSHFEAKDIKNLIEASDIRKLLTITKFNRAGGEIEYDFDKD